MDLNASVLAGFSGILLSLGLNYIPGLNVKFAKLSSEWKSAIVALLLLVVTLLVGASSCLNLWVLISCDKQGFMRLAEIFITALIANQGAYAILPQTKAVKEAKSKR